LMLNKVNGCYSGCYLGCPVTSLTLLPGPEGNLQQLWEGAKLAAVAAAMEVVEAAPMAAAAAVAAVVT